MAQLGSTNVYGSINITGTATAPTFIGDLTGNATSADAWSTARSIALSGAVTGTASIDGSGDVTIATTATSDPTLTLSGDASGSATFTNLGDATLTVTIANDSHTHDGRYFTETESDSRFAFKAGSATQAFSASTFTGDLVGDVTGNATTATRLETSRSINGTPFNGTSAITTANWGTARTLTIGDTGKSVNGSGNISWSLAEIGAVNKAGDTMTGNLTVDNGTNTTVTVRADDTGVALIQLIGDSQGTGRVYVGQSTTHGGGIEYNGDGNPVGSGSGSDYVTLYRTTDSVDHWTARNKHDTSTWEFRGQVQAPSFSGPLTGNASSATRLVTSRTINGSLFNGTSNILTSRWGQPRTLSLSGDVSGAISIDGSSNMVLATTVANDSHTHDIRYYTQSESNARFLQDAPVDSKQYGRYNGAWAEIDIGGTSRYDFYPNVTAGMTQIVLQNIEAFVADVIYNGIHLYSDDFTSSYDGGTGHTTITLAQPVGDSNDSLQISAYTVQGLSAAYVVLSDPISGAIVADSARKLETPRTISLSGDASGSVSFDGSQNVTISTNISSINNSLAVTGSFTATGNITAFFSSDERIKRNITEIKSPLSKVCSLRTSEYEKDDGKGEFTYEVGLIAQDVEKVFPHLVEENDLGVKCIRHGGNDLISLALAAIKEQQEQIKELQKPWYVKLYNRIRKFI